MCRWRANLPARWQSAPGNRRMTDRSAAVVTALKVYLCLALVITCLWTQLDQLGWGFLVVLALAIGLDARPGWFVPADPGDEEAAAQPLMTIARRLFPPGLTWRSVAIAASICTPLLVHLALTL